MSILTHILKSTFAYPMLMPFHLNLSCSGSLQGVCRPGMQGGGGCCSFLASPPLRHPPLMLQGVSSYSQLPSPSFSWVTCGLKFPRPPCPSPGTWTSPGEDLSPCEMTCCCDHSSQLCPLKTSHEDVCEMCSCDLHGFRFTNVYLKHLPVRFLSAAALFLVRRVLLLFLLLLG